MQVQPAGCCLTRLLILNHTCIRALRLFATHCSLLLLFLLERICDQALRLFAALRFLLLPPGKIGIEASYDYMIGYILLIQVLPDLSCDVVAVATSGSNQHILYRLPDLIRYILKLGAQRDKGTSNTI